MGGFWVENFTEMENAQTGSEMDFDHNKDALQRSWLSKIDCASHEEEKAGDVIEWAPPSDHFAIEKVWKLKFSGFRDCDRFSVDVQTAW